MKKTALMISAALGTTLSSLALTALPGMAVTLDNGGTDETAFINTYGITKIGEVEGIAGGNSKELFFGDQGSSDGNPQSAADLTWQNGFTYNWTLTWDPSTNQATFTVNNAAGTPSINFTFAPTTLDKFNAFGLIAKANDPDSKLPEETIINLGFNSVSFTGNNGTGDGGTISLTDSVTSTSSTTVNDFDKQFYIINDTDRANGVEIREMTGTFSMLWDGSATSPQTLNANSRISFELKLFDPPAATAAVPEPSAMLGLLSLGALGATSTLKRKKGQK